MAEKRRLNFETEVFRTDLSMFKQILKNELDFGFVLSTCLVWLMLYPPEIANDTFSKNKERNKQHGDRVLIK